MLSRIKTLILRFLSMMSGITALWYLLFFIFSALLQTRTRNMFHGMNFHIEECSLKRACALTVFIVHLHFLLPIKTTFLLSLCLKQYGASLVLDILNPMHTEQFRFLCTQCCFLCKSKLLKFSSVAFVLLIQLIFSTATAFFFYHSIYPDVADSSI